MTLVSEAAIERLAHAAGHDVDGRRFRMLFTLAGCSEHEEDSWEGRLVGAGEAVLRIGARCRAVRRRRAIPTRGRATSTRSA